MQNVTLTAAAGGFGSGQITVTNERGAYQFTRLVPGVHIIKAELAGSAPPSSAASK